MYGLLIVAAVLYLVFGLKGILIGGAAFLAFVLLLWLAVGITKAADMLRNSQRR